MLGKKVQKRLVNPTFHLHPSHSKSYFLVSSSRLGHMWWRGSKLTITVFVGGSGVLEWPMTTNELGHTVTQYISKCFLVCYPLCSLSACCERYRPRVFQGGIWASGKLNNLHKIKTQKAGPGTFGLLGHNAIWWAFVSNMIFPFSGLSRTRKLMFRRWLLPLVSSLGSVLLTEMSSSNKYSQRLWALKIGNVLNPSELWSGQIDCYW